MTNQEAMVELNRLKTVTTVPPDVERRDKAIEMAKDALRKQVPRKPVYIRSIQLGDCFGCPICEEILMRVKTDYCCYCGQALDWSDN